MRRLVGLVQKKSVRVQRQRTRVLGREGSFRRNCSGSKMVIWMGSSDVYGIRLNRRLGGRTV
jgi:hypothetical protein